MASTIANAGAAGVFATVAAPVARRRLWHVIAAALGRADLAQKQAGTDDEAIGWAPPPEDTARAAKAMILVAEDNTTNQVVIRRLLSQRGYAHHVAENGVEALKLYATGGYGLLLTDFHMPEMDGFQLTQEIRRGEGATDPRLPIVALTADALPGTAQQCLDAGMDGYLSKPIDSAALTEILARLLPQAQPLRQRPGGAPAGAATPAAAPSSAIDPAILDLELLRDTFGDIGEDAVAFLNGFLDEVPGLLQEIAASLASRNQSAARHAAHALKGAARSAGAKQLGDIAAALQDRLDAQDLDGSRPLYQQLEPAVTALRATVARLTPAEGAEAAQ
jgi:CheY-like chemotaxis protein